MPSRVCASVLELACLRCKSPSISCLPHLWKTNRMSALQINTHPDNHPDKLSCVGCLQNMCAVWWTVAEMLLAWTRYRGSYNSRKIMTQLSHLETRTAWEIARPGSDKYHLRARCLLQLTERLVHFLSFHLTAGPTRRATSIYWGQPVVVKKQNKTKDCFISVKNDHFRNVPTFFGCVVLSEKLFSTELKKLHLDFDWSHHIMTGFYIFSNPMTDERRLWGAVYQGHKLILIVFGKIFIFHLRTKSISVFFLILNDGLNQTETVDCSKQNK